MFLRFWESPEDQYKICLTFAHFWSHIISQIKTVNLYNVFLSVFFGTFIQISNFSLILLTLCVCGGGVQ